MLETLIKKGSRKATMERIHKPVDYIITEREGNNIGR